jgi:hypothetical protein
MEEALLTSDPGAAGLWSVESRAVEPERGLAWLVVGAVRCREGGDLGFGGMTWEDFIPVAQVGFQVWSASLAAWLDHVVPCLIGLARSCHAGSSCWADPSGPFVPGHRPHRATAIGSCHAHPGGLGVEPRQGPTWALCWHGPQTFWPGRARARPKMLCFGPAHEARPEWPDIYASSFICKQLCEHVWCEPDMQVTSYAINCVNTCGVNQLYQHEVDVLLHLHPVHPT